MNKNKNSGIILTGTLVGILGLNLLGAYIDSKVITNNGGKTMPVIQPWITVYDTTGDGTADYTVVKLRGGDQGAIPIIYTRQSTKEEINWYKSRK